MTLPHSPTTTSISSFSTLARKLGRATLASWVVGSALLGIPLRAEADTLVGPAQRTNVTDGDAQALEQLFVDSYSVEAKERVLVVRVAADSPPLSDPAGEAVRVGAEEYVVLSFVGLGKNIQMRASRHRADGSVIHSVKVTIESLESAPPVIDRVARALSQKVTFEDTRGVRNETREEKSGFEKVLGVKTGGFYVWDKQIEYAPLMTIAFDARLEMPRYFIEVGGGFGFPITNSNSLSNDLGGFFGELGASVYLTETDVSPYIGAGLMPRLWFADGWGGGANLAAYGQIGAMFMRSRSTRLYVDFRVAPNLSEVVTTHPVEMGLQVGVGF